jgi:hypothetical protein
MEEWFKWILTKQEVREDVEWMHLAHDRRISGRDDLWIRVHCGEFGKLSYKQRYKNASVLHRQFFFHAECYHKKLGAACKWS